MLHTDNYPILEFDTDSQFRGFDYGALIYGGDDVTQEAWDNREWRNCEGIRYNLVLLCERLVQEM